MFFPLIQGGFSYRTIMKFTKHGLNRLFSALCLVAFIILSYSLILGRGQAIPEVIDQYSIRHIVLTHGDQTRVLRSVHVDELEALTKTLAKLELKPGLAPVRKDKEVATMAIWTSRGKYENKYIFMEKSVMKTEGLAIPYHYVLIEDHGMMNLIKEIVSQPDPIKNYQTPEEYEENILPDNPNSP